MSMLGPLILIAGVASTFGCKVKPKVRPVEEAYGAIDDVPDGALAARPLVGRARCRQEAELPVGAPFELGEQAPLGGKTLVAIATGVGLNRVGKLLTLDESGKVVSARELGKLEREAPPPVLSTQVATQVATPVSTEGSTAPSAWAVAYFKQGSKRESEVFIEGNGKSYSTVVPQQSDDAYGLSLAIRGDDVLVAWDEDQPGGKGSHVRAALVRGGSIAHSAVLSDAASDVDAPQVAATAGGFAIAWVNRRSLAFSEAAADRLESPGEMPAFEWIEAATLDKEGQLSGRPFDLTSRTGHARAFSLAGGIAGGVVAIRMDDAAIKAAGARLDFLTLGRDRAVSTVAGEGVGRSVPGVLRGDGGDWVLQTTDEMDQPVIWFNSSGVWSGSHEDSIVQGRVIRALAHRRVLVAFGDRGIIARLACE